MTSQVALAFWEVFRIPNYAVLTAVMAVVVFVFALWLPNIALVWDISLSSTVPFVAKIRILTGLIGSIATNYTFTAGAALVLAALLLGANVSMFVHGAGTRWRAGASGGAGFIASLGGLASSLVGIGCAACGTFILGPLFTLLGAGSLIASLPFGGEEFIALGIGLLALSLWLQARSIALPVACTPQRSD
jgi:hypothetical protein